MLLYVFSEIADLLVQFTNERLCQLNAYNFT